MQSGSSHAIALKLVELLGRQPTEGELLRTWNHTRSEKFVQAGLSATPPPADSGWLEQYLLAEGAAKLDSVAKAWACALLQLCSSLGLDRAPPAHAADLEDEAQLRSGLLAMERAITAIAFLRERTLSSAHNPLSAGLTPSFYAQLWAVLHYQSSHCSP